MARKQNSAGAQEALSGQSKPTENTGKMPRHRRPATMFSVERDQAKWALQAGRCIEDTADEFHAKDYVISEIWLRDHERRLREVELSVLRGPAATVERKPIESARSVIAEIKRSA